jgi:hypothetical protein
MTKVLHEVVTLRWRRASNTIAWGILYNCNELRKVRLDKRYSLSKHVVRGCFHYQPESMGIIACGFIDLVTARIFQDAFFASL